MKLALCMRSFEESISKGIISLSDFIYETKTQGFNAVDVLAPFIQDYTAAKGFYELLSQENIKVVNYSTRLTAISVMDDAPNILAKFETEFAKASILRSPYIGIRTNTGKELIFEDEVLQKVLAGYKKLIALAKKYNLKIVVENVKGVSSCPETIEIIVSRFKGKVYACLDTGNFPPSHRYSSNRRIIPLAAHCHFKTFNFDEDGLESTIDTRLCIIQLLEANFSGYVAIEYEGGGNEKQGVEKSSLLLKKLLQETI